ncbi:MAG: cobalamin B12-binding domain-containing protein [Planctomycetota bacterium]|mgnify:CR=1 FL=1
MTEKKRIRVLIAKPGLDGHDRGAKVIACALRDAGMEVIYSGLHQTAEMIVEAAIQEDVNVIGISILSGAHLTIFPEILNLMKKKKIKNVLLIGGGIIPDEDRTKLKKKGVGKLFGPGTPLQEIVEYIKTHAKLYQVT